MDRQRQARLAMRSGGSLSNARLSARQQAAAGKGTGILASVVDVNKRKFVKPKEGRRQSMRGSSKQNPLGALALKTPVELLLDDAPELADFGVRTQDEAAAHRRLQADQAAAAAGGAAPAGARGSADPVTVAMMRAGAGAPVAVVDAAARSKVLPPMARAGYGEQRRLRDRLRQEQRRRIDEEDDEEDDEADAMTLAQEMQKEADLSNRVMRLLARKEESKRKDEGRRDPRDVQKRMDARDRLQAAKRGQRPRDKPLSPRSAAKAKLPPVTVYPDPSPSGSGLKWVESDLPLLRGDAELDDVDLPKMRALRWRELQWLHSLMVKLEKPIDRVATLMNLEGGVPREHFVVGFTGFLGVNPWVVHPRLKSLFRSFDVSDTGQIDPKELQAHLRLLHFPWSPPAEMILRNFALYAHQDHRGRVCIPRLSLIMLLFLPCVTQSEEDRMRVKLAQLASAFERNTGDSFPAMIPRGALETALRQSPRLMDEYRLQALQRMPSTLRMAVMRRGVEQASLKVQAHEEALSQFKANVFLRDKVAPRMRAQFWAMWKLYHSEVRLERELDAKAEVHYLTKRVRVFLRRWRHRAFLPKAIALSTKKGKVAMMRRSMAKWQLWWRLMRKIRGIGEKREEAERQRRVAIAERWGQHLNDKHRLQLLTACFHAMTLNYAERRRERRAAELMRKQLKRRALRCLWEATRLQRAEREAEEEGMRAADQAERHRMQEMVQAQRDREEAKREAMLQAEKEAREYAERLRVQRTKAAINTSVSETARAVRMRHANRRQRVFQEAMLQAAEDWDTVVVPKLVEAERQRIFKWLTTEAAGKEQLADRIEYVLQAVEIAVPPHAGGDGGAAAAGARSTATRSIKGTVNQDKMSHVVAGHMGVATVAGMQGHVDQDTVQESLRAEMAKPGSSPADAIHDFGMRQTDPWQLSFRFRDYFRVWTNVNTGEQIGPTGSGKPRPQLRKLREALAKATIPAMTYENAQRIALETYLCRLEPDIKNKVDLMRGSHDDKWARNAFAQVIQDWWHLAYRVKVWKETLVNAKKAARVVILRGQARRRDAAVRAVQCAMRMKLARAELLRRLVSQWAIAIDHSNRCIYYTNLQTGESRWEPPLLLGHLATWSCEQARRRRLNMMSPRARDQLLAYLRSQGRGMAHPGYADWVEEARQLREHSERLDAAVKEAAEGDSEVRDLLLESAGVTAALTRLDGDASRPERRQRWETVFTQAGTFYTQEGSSRRQRSPPPGYIMCEFCSQSFAECYQEDEDCLYCGPCFVHAHNKGDRTGTVAWMVHPGQYLTCWQTPNHINRRPRDVFGERFAKKFEELQAKRARRDANGPLYFDLFLSGTRAAEHVQQRTRALREARDKEDLLHYLAVQDQEQQMALEDQARPLALEDGAEHTGLLEDAAEDDDRPQAAAPAAAAAGAGGGDS